MEIKSTVTTLFMMLPLKIPKEHLEQNSFINAYSFDDSKDYQDCVYLLFKPKNTDIFRLFLESEYERTKQLIDDYDYPDGYVVLVYKLEDKWREDYDLIRQSKYSKTSPEFQALFPKVIKIVLNGLRRDEISLQYRIFQKTNDLVEFWEEKFGINFDPEFEVWSWFDKESETLDILKIKEYVE